MAPRKPKRYHARPGNSVRQRAARDKATAAALAARQLQRDTMGNASSTSSPPPSHSAEDSPLVNSASSPASSLAAGTPAKTAAASTKKASVKSAASAASTPRTGGTAAAVPNVTRLTPMLQAEASFDLGDDYEDASRDEDSGTMAKLASIGETPRGGSRRRKEAATPPNSSSSNRARTYSTRRAPSREASRGRDGGRLGAGAEEVERFYTALTATPKKLSEREDTFNADDTSSPKRGSLLIHAFARVTDAKPLSFDDVIDGWRNGIFPVETMRGQMQKALEGGDLSKRLDASDARHVVVEAEGSIGSSFYFDLISRSEVESVREAHRNSIASYHHGTAPAIRLHLLFSARNVACEVYDKEVLSKEKRLLVAHWPIVLSDCVPTTRKLSITGVSPRILRDQQLRAQLLRPISAWTLSEGLKADGFLISFKCVDHAKQAAKLFTGLDVDGVRINCEEY